MIDVLFIGVGLLAVVLGTWRAVRARRTGTGAGLAVAIIALGAALCFLANGFQLVESRIYPSLGRLLSNLATMVAAYGIELTVAEISGRGGGRRLRLAVLGVALATLAGTFFATPGLPTGLGLFDELYRAHPTLVVYILTYTAYLGFAVVDIAIVSVLTMRVSRGALRAGLAMLLAASVLAIAYLTGKIVETVQDLGDAHPVARVCAGPFATTGCTLAVGFPALSVLLIVLGLSVPAIPGAWQGIRDGAAMRELHPLRAELARRFPDVVRLDEAGTRRERLLAAMSETNDGLILSGVTPSMSADAAAECVRAGARVGVPLSGSGGVAEPGFAAEVARLRAIARSYRTAR